MSSSVMTMLGVGIFCLVIFGGLTLFSYVNRDAVTGEFVVWYKGLIVGTVNLVAAYAWHSMENEPLA
jgi:hypothetical protein